MFHGLTIREYILKNQNHDTAFWAYGTGADYILSYLLKYSDKDWSWLNKEILKWQQEELEILAISLAYNEQFPQEADRILVQRFNLFSIIFENIEAAEAYNLLDELLEFLNIKELVIEKSSLLRIQKQFDTIKAPLKEKPYFQWFSEIQSKINSRIELTVNQPNGSITE